MSFSDTGATGLWLVNAVHDYKREDVLVEKILDVGCAGSIHASRIPAHVGIDLRKDPMIPKGSEFKLMDARKMSFKAATFDKVILANVLTFVGSPAYDLAPSENGLEVAYAEALRVCKPGGIILITTGVGDSSPVRGPAGYARSMDVAEIKSLFGLGTDLVEDTYYIRRRSDYRRCEANSVVGALNHGFYADGAAVVCLRRNDQPVPTLAELLNRPRPVNARLPAVPLSVPEKNSEAAIQAQLNKARNMGRSE